MNQSIVVLTSRHSSVIFSMFATVQLVAKKGSRFSEGIVAVIEART